jgi:nucleotide-binding universal stress UspA family protein
MFESILVAVDGSRQGGKTVPVAIEMATRFGSRVTVVHVREHARYEGDDVDLGPDGGTGEELIAEVVETFHSSGIETSGELRRVRPGDTHEQIVKVAEETEADLIVMGTRGMSEWKSLVLGGVANKVVAQASCPVLLVR